jgi:hypothetical protein
MSLDFALTQFYRLVVDDLILMYDVYLFYSRYKKDKRSLKEFSEVLADVMQVEAANFEGIDETKLSQDSEERVENMVRDYFMSIVVRYMLDDLSQVSENLFFFKKVRYTGDVDCNNTSILLGFKCSFLCE